MESKAITKCQSCGKDLLDSPPNLEICVECLTKIVIKEGRKLQKPIREFDEG